MSSASALGRCPRSTDASRSALVGSSPPPPSRDRANELHAPTSSSRQSADRGVQHIWGIPGDSLQRVHRRPAPGKDMAWMHVRHEEAAAFAAGAKPPSLGTRRRRPGSCGPGNMHFINGLYDAQRSQVPVLAIASHPVKTDRHHLLPGNPSGAAVRRCSVCCELAHTPTQFARILNIAVRTAVEERGVAVP